MMLDMQFVQQINELSEQTIQLCYHCHKCTSGCLFASEMTYGPDRILRLIQLGQRETLLNSQDIWLCASCETCGSRCPNEIDISRVMDALRFLSIQEKTALRKPDSVKFHQLFLGILKHFGRMYEAGLMGIYTLWTQKLAVGPGMVVKMLVKGKAPILPSTVKGRAEIRKIYKMADQALEETAVWAPKKEGR
jgi:heterodisulfide reductase subunit C